MENVDQAWVEEQLRKSNVFRLIMKAVEKEYIRSFTLYNDFKSLHEGYAVLLEEVDELWDDIKKKEHNLEDIKNEALQVATMAVKLIIFIESDQWKK